MKTAIRFFGLILGMYGVSAAAQEEVDWMDRCNADAVANRDAGLVRDVFDFNACMTTILNYCTFAAASEDCFANLETEYGTRAAEIISLLPEGIDGPEIQQRIYSNRVANIADLGAQLGCSDQMTATSCGARNVLFQWQLARTTAEWIKKFEDDN